MNAKIVTRQEFTSPANASVKELPDDSNMEIVIRNALTAQGLLPSETKDVEQVALLAKELAAHSRCLKTPELSLLLELLSVLVLMSKSERSVRGYYLGHIRDTISRLKAMLRSDA